MNELDPLGAVENDLQAKQAAQTKVPDEINLLAAIMGRLEATPHPKARKAAYWVSRALQTLGVRM